MSHGEVLIKAENVSKKFCRNLKRSLWYGITDIARSVVGMRSTGALRKDEFWAVRGVSFEVRRGECLGLIGHNGAGKSTLLKMLNGLIRPDEGRIEMRGKIGALIELGAGFNPLLTGRENVYTNGAVLGFSKEEIDSKFNEIVDFADLADFIDTPVQNYSSGMKVRLGFAVASQMEPDILIVDEVLAVGDIGFRIKCLNRINEIMPNTAVIFVSHNMPQVAKMVTSIRLMDKGTILFEGANVLEGIEMYFDQFGTETFSKAGDGIELINFKINEQDAIQNSIDLRHDQGLSINIDFKSLSNFKYLRVVVVFVDKNLTPLVSFSSGNIKVGSHELQSLYCKVNDLFLGIGKYSVNLLFFDSNINTEQMFSACRFDAISQVSIKGSDFFSKAALHLKSEWEQIKL